MTAFEYSAEDARRTVEVAYLGLRAAGVEPDEVATEQEHVRSPRMDTSLGKKVRGLFERDLVGHLAVVYRLNEEAGRDLARAQGYRVAPYIADLGKKGA